MSTRRRFSGDFNVKVALEALREAERLVARSFAVYDSRRLGAVARLPRCRLDRHSKKC